MDSLNISPVMIDFLEFLVEKGFSDTVTNLVEGVFQRAFFEEWVAYLTIRKTTGNPVVDFIKDTLMEDDS